MPNNSYLFKLNTAQKTELKEKTRRAFFSAPYYFVDDLIPVIIDEYVSYENDKVKQLVKQGGIKERLYIRSYIYNHILNNNHDKVDLKWQNNGYPVLTIQKSIAEESGIWVPRNIDFFKSAFSLYRVRSGNTEQTVTIDNRVLDAMSFNDELEDIVADNSIRQVGAIGTAAVYAIVTALRFFGIYKDMSTNINHIEEGIKIFQKLYMGIPADDYNGILNKEILLAMNEASNRRVVFSGTIDGIHSKGKLSEKGIEILKLFENPPVYDEELKKHGHSEGKLPYYNYMKMKGTIDITKGRVGLHHPGDYTVSYGFGYVIHKDESKTIRRPAITGAMRRDHPNISIEEANQHLRSKLPEFEKTANQRLNNLNAKEDIYNRFFVKQNEFDALLSIEYNSGNCRPVIEDIIKIKKEQGENLETWPQKIQQIIESHRITYEGLKKRRNEEADIFLQGVYDEDFHY